MVIQKTNIIYLNMPTYHVALRVRLITVFFSFCFPHIQIKIYIFIFYTFF